MTLISQQGSQNKKIEFLREELERFKVEEDERDLLLEVLQGKVRVGIGIDSFESMVNKYFLEGRLLEADIALFETRVGLIQLVVRPQNTHAKPFIHS